MASIKRIAITLGVVLLIAGASVYLYGMTQQIGPEFTVDYRGIGKDALIVGFILLVGSFASESGMRGVQTRSLLVKLGGALFALVCALAAYLAYIMGGGMNIYAVVLGAACLYLVIRVIQSFRKNY